MNWKVLCLLPSLTLATTLPAYSSTISNSHARSTVIAQSGQQGGAMTNHNGTMKPGTMMNHDAMTKKPGAMMNHDAMMGMGSRGESVKAAQSFLKQKGFYTGPVNGIFGSQTRAAVMKFQKSKGLSPDGMIGPRTRAAMS